MYAYRTPRVVFEWRDTRARIIDGLRTDIAGFVGIAERGPLHRPLKVESWTQFISLFGSYVPQGYLAYAVEGFFANGGQTCWVVRVADPDHARPASLELRDSRGRPVLELTAANRYQEGRETAASLSLPPAYEAQATAASLLLPPGRDERGWLDPGAWAHQITVTVTRTGRDRFSLILRLRNGAPEIWRDLSLVEEDRMGRFVETILNDLRHGSRLVMAKCLRPTVPGDAAGAPNPQATNLFNGIGRLTGGQDGLAPTADLLDAHGERRLILIATIPTAPDRWIRATVEAGDEGRFTLRVDPPDGQGESWPDLTLDRDDAHFVERVLNHPGDGSKLIRVLVLEAPEDAAGLVAACYQMEGGLSEQHFCRPGEPGRALGLATLEPVDEVSIVAIPDLMPKPWAGVKIQAGTPRCSDLEAEPAPPPPVELPPEYPPRLSDETIVRLQQTLIAHCEQLQDRIALIDPPIDRVNPTQMVEWRRAQFATGTTYAALYYPWIMASDPLRLDGLLRALPPCGHIAGVFARVDRRDGVHRPPANEVLNGALDIAPNYNEQLRTSAVTRRGQRSDGDVPGGIDDVAHGLLNDNQVNLIRPYPGRGIRIMGERILERGGEIRYVNVRRLMMMIAETIDERTQWTVFEPNNPMLWLDIEQVVVSFLTTLWQRGMLDGATREEAFMVRCDASTNPPEETALGRVICYIGVQPPWPAEFVVVRIGKTESGVAVLEGNRI